MRKLDKIHQGSTSRGNLLRDERGGATVEFVISMLIIVPVFMYGILLQDILMGRLDLQESVTVAAWDFSAYSHLAANSEVARFNRLTWCNHTSMYDSFRHSYDCQAEDHHADLGAHICWLGPDAEQVQCHRNSNVGKPTSTDIPARFHDEFNRGGMFTCHGRISFLNRLVPGEFLTQWSEEDFAPHDQHQLDVRMETGGDGMLDCDPAEDDCDSVHQSARDADSDQATTLRENRFAIIADSWDIRSPAPIEPGEASTDPESLFARVNWLYRNNLAFPEYSVSVAEFFQKALDEELLNVPVYPFSMGDNPLTPNVSDNYDPASGDITAQQVTEPNSTTFYHTVPIENKWSAGGDQRYQQTWDGRGPYYMGRDEPSRR